LGAPGRRSPKESEKTTEAAPALRWQQRQVPSDPATHGAPHVWQRVDGSGTSAALSGRFVAAASSHSTSHVRHTLTPLAALRIGSAQNGQPRTPASAARPACHTAATTSAAKLRSATSRATATPPHTGHA